METDDFSKIQMSVFTFFEIKVKKSALFKAKLKVEKKELDLEKCKDKDKPKKEAELKQLNSELKAQRKEALKSEIPDWLTECCDKAKSVDKPMFKVSHATKFTNGLIEYGGIYREPSTGSSDYLTTEALQNSYFDITNSNGNLITHARFLMAKLDDDSVYEKLEKADDSWLFEFTKSKKQVKQWSEGLSLWVDEVNLRDASGLKQNYFYLPDGSYHLTAPLFATSLCQGVYERIRPTKFGKENISLRKARKNKQYDERILVEYPQLAIMRFGGTQPQNITAGNFERHGEAFLLRCTPPTWESNLEPPSELISLFHGDFDRRAWMIAKNLQTYLVRLEKAKSNKRIRDHVTQTVYQLIDTLLGYVAEIHNLKDQAGWSENAEKLKQSHKLWLDPYRDDNAFQTQRKSGEWQAEVCKDFGLWLNKKLEHKKMVFGKIESSHWAKLLKRQLREFERDLKREKEASV